MKNIAVLAGLVIMSFSGNFAPLYGEDGGGKDYSFTISPQAGFVYGQVLELVYQDNRNNREFLSELKYDMKPVFYLGLQLDYGKTDIMSKKGFFSSVSFKIGIPGDSGTHENRDWMGDGNNNLTHFSTHTSKTREFFVLDAVIGMSIPVKSIFYITPFISGSWMHFAFAGKNGYGEYPPGSAPTDFTGQTVIKYKQDWLLAAAGFTIGTKALSGFTFELSFKISPLTYCIAFDEHITRNETFKDYSQFGLYLEPGAGICYSYKNIDFSLDFNYRYIGNTRGFTLHNDSIYRSANDAGAGLSLLDTRFLVKIRL